MNRYITINEWKPASNLSFDPVTLKVITSESNMMVSAGPGAGKTELLAQRATFLLQTNKSIYPRQILALSYKVDAAKNLESRVKERCGDLLSKRFASRTYDAFAKTILDQFGNLLPLELQPAVDYEIASIKDVKEAFIATGYQTEVKNKFYTNSYLAEFKLPFAETEYGDIARKVWPVMLRGKGKLKPKLTFAMIARLAELIVRTNPAVWKSIRFAYGHIFLDEFQDTPRHHYDLIKSCFMGTDCILTAVGDNKQRVMGWAGALEKVFELFKKDFFASSETMLVNHRSAPRLVRLQKPVIEKLIGQSLDIKPNDRWSGDEGVSEVWQFLNEEHEAMVVSNKIKVLMDQNRLKCSDICILTRKLPAEYTSNIISLLKKLNIESRVEEQYQTLLKEDLILIYQCVFQLASNVKSPDEWTFLIGILRRLKGYSARTPDTLLIDLENRFNIYLESVRHRLPTISTEEDLLDLTKGMLRYFDQELLHGLYRQYNKGYVELLTGQFVGLVWKEFSQCKDWILSIERFKGIHSIPIMTIHKSKGLEYNTVFLIGLEDSAFFGSPDEELCTFFVAISRAIERLYITTCIKRGADKNSTSKIKLFYNLWKSANIGQSISFTRDFEEKYQEYFGEAK
ncbi:UvrD-helicase domain-containing protein [Brevibacillus sp. NRS-1366]|uniref:UvrD-helicase domain-containing protein n=1 Tax=Brevibacillus sp. NRS-1366 TaxID=3233899 RepID=UPI003D24F1C1